jgi:hypothetical protein
MGEGEGGGGQTGIGIPLPFVPSARGGEIFGENFFLILRRKFLDLNI